MAAFFTQLREDFLRFVRAYKVIRKNMLYILYAFLDDRFIIRTTILALQKLKHIDQGICPFLDFLCQAFPDNLTVKVLAELVLYFFTGAFNCSIFPSSYGT